MQTPFIGGAYTARSTNLDAQSCINLYPEMDESGKGKNVGALIGTPGTRLLVTLGGVGPVRGVWTPTIGNMIAVQGNSVYRVSSAWVATFAGSIGTNSGPVSIADNGFDAIIVDGVSGHVIDLTTSTMTQINDPAFYGADRVVCTDGYFIFNRPGTDQFYISGLNDTTFDALDFSSVGGSAIVSFINDHRQIIFFNSESGKIFENTGNVDFPYQQSGNVYIEQGCAAKFGVAKIDNTVFWLGSNKSGNGIIWRLDGATPRRISTHAIELAIQGYSRIDDCIAYAYQTEGHSFIVWTFPTAEATWVFDAATNLWHQRSYRNTSTGIIGRHRSNCHAFFGGEHVVGDCVNGNLYTLDLDCYSDNGDPMPAIRSGVHISDADYERMPLHSFQVDIEAGVGLNSGQGVNPQIAMDYSDDGAHTWSREKWKSLGAIGNFKARARWTRLGKMTRDRVYRVTITDPVKRVIIGAASK